MNERHTDDDIADLFARANPFPGTRAARQPTADAHIMAPDDGRVTFVDDNERVDSQRRRPPGRWWIVTGVAASVALVVSLLVLAATRDANEPAPADQPIPAPTVPATSNDELVEGFVAALNERDLTSVQALTATDVVANILDQTVENDDLPALLEWYAAWDWRWDDLACDTSEGDDAVSCEVVEQNRLTDLVGVDRPATVTFQLENDRITRVGMATRSASYSAEAFLPFKRWVVSNHESAVASMWLGSGPRLTTESAVLFDRYLTEYIEQYEAEPTDDETDSTVPD